MVTAAAASLVPGSQLWHCVLEVSCPCGGLLVVHPPDGGRRGGFPGRPVWERVPEAAAWSLPLQPFADVYIPNSMHQIPLLLPILRVVLVA